MEQNAAQKAFQAWMDSPAVDGKTKAAIQAFSPAEREAAFCSELAFGTGGLRGAMGLGTNRMNRYTVARATRGLGEYLLNTGGKRVAIGYDTRNGSRELAGITAGVLAGMKLEVWLYDQPLPTPMLSYAVRELACDAGVVITASHNPAEYNGYKVYGADGCQITDGAASAITGCIQHVGYDQLDWLTEQEARAKELLRTVPRSVYQQFMTDTLACRICTNGEGQPLRVVYTPLHGTGLLPVRDVLSRLPGVQVTFAEEQCGPDGNFPTCPKPNPELPEALALGLSLAEREQADLLLATDPDCDRVGVAVREENGQYRILSGNEVGLLLLEYILSRRAKQGENQPVVVKTIVTSDLAFSMAQRYGARVVEVLTGFKYIGEAIGRMEAAGERDRFAFGFEESCGYLAGTHVRDKDGVSACLLLAEMAQVYASEGVSLAQALQAIYACYGYIGTRLLSFDIQGVLPMDAMAQTMKRLRVAPPSTLGESFIVQYTDYLPGVGALPKSDVLSFATDEGAKAIVRPSGTEPKMKVYLSAKGKNKTEADAQLERMIRQVCGWMDANAGR